ncbi:putative GMC-type oxidoreductase [Planoprotostelium fungivorum]|uniref:Putative GMC-type oxidoreductase n=1 Tax=Planoprotostelium fungivorum TaxID=1890364 RepID=A0A2P6N6B9_9EUKA|nr:putative GMC-type oxidoreductase [Planoprotostelium fungivorum]
MISFTTFSFSVSEVLLMILRIKEGRSTDEDNNQSAGPDRWEVRTIKVWRFLSGRIRRMECDKDTFEMNSPIMKGYLLPAALHECEPVLFTQLKTLPQEIIKSFHTTTYEQQLLCTNMTSRLVILVPLVLLASLGVLYHVPQAVVLNSGRTVLSVEERQAPGPHGPANPPSPPSPPSQADDVERYDYVVVGAGPAGSQVAHDLAATTKSSVLLLESGQANWDDINFVDWAGWNGARNSFENNINPSSDNRYSWPMFLSADKTIYGARAAIGAGRGVGGGSAVNTAMFVVGGSYVFDHFWPASWAYNNIKSHVRAITDWVNPFVGTRRTPPQEAWLQAASNIAAKQNTLGGDDYLINRATPGRTPIEPQNSPNTVDYNDVDGINSVTVFGQLQMFDEVVNSTFARRIYAQDLFNSTVMDRSTGRGKGSLSRLQISWGSAVSKITWKKVQGVSTADTVQYVKNGVSKTVKIGKEVVLSAGTFLSPTILQRSGVGNAARLAALGVKDIVYNNTEVGQNMQNHYGAQMVGVANGNLTDISKYWADFVSTWPGLGPYRSGAFFGWNKYDPNRPQQSGASQRVLQTYFTAGVNGPSAASQATFNLSPAASRSFTINNCIVYLSSRGTVEIADPSDPSVLPNMFYQLLPTYTFNASLPAASQYAAAAKIEQNIIMSLMAYYQSYDMIREMNSIIKAQGYNFTLSFAMPLENDVATLWKGVERLGADWFKMMWSWNVNASTSAEDKAFNTACINLINVAKANNYRASHQVGTNTIMKVVDDRLRVLGVKGVRVADQSISPVPAAGNTAFSAFLIGARAAELIRQDNQ